MLNLVPILALSATPMLVSVMTGLGGSVARSVLAGVALLVTATGVGLLLAQRTAGMLLLIAAGVINAVLAVQMISATNLYFLTSVMWTMGYALIPAAIGGLLGIVALARPVVRSLRS